MSHSSSRTFPDPVCELDGVTHDGFEVKYMMVSRSPTVKLRKSPSCPTIFAGSIRWGEGPSKYAPVGKDKEWSGMKEASLGWRF